MTSCQSLPADTISEDSNCYLNQLMMRFGKKVQTKISFFFSKSNEILNQDEATFFVFSSQRLRQGQTTNNLRCN